MNIENRTIFTGDCLDIMRGMADECIDLIYLDPPSNSNASYAASTGSSAAGKGFKDTWGLSDIDSAWWGEIEEACPSLYKLLTAVRDVDSEAMMYMVYMGVRVIEMRRLLKPTGSIYLHCNQFSEQYRKLMMDAVFGRQNFINEIIWHYRTLPNREVPEQRLAVSHDTLLAFAAVYGKHRHNQQYRPYSIDEITERFPCTEDNGRKYRKARSQEGDVVRHYLDEDPGIPLSTVWSDIPRLTYLPGWSARMEEEATGSPVQKPFALLQRVIQTSSNEGGWVLDLFCGSGTTCDSADVLDRNWIGIDISEAAAKLTESRIGRLLWPITHRTDIPTDREGKRSKDIRYTLYGIQGGVCAGCQSWFPFRDMTLAYMASGAKGGIDAGDHLQLLCGRAAPREEIARSKSCWGFDDDRDRAHTALM